MAEDKRLELEQEARIALLQHFSSKSTSQATIILTTVLAFFAFVQTLQLIEKWLEWQVLLYESWILALLIFVGVRAVGRLIRWGMLADRILKVKLGSEDKVGKPIKKTENEPERPGTLFEQFYSAIQVEPMPWLVRAFDKSTNTPYASLLPPLIASALLWCLNAGSNYIKVMIQIPNLVVFGVAILYSIDYYAKQSRERGVGYDTSQVPV